jgi:hypothetical protein
MLTFSKSTEAPVISEGKRSHAELRLRPVAPGPRRRRDGYLGAALAMKREHLTNVHPVHVVRAEDGDHVGIVLLDEIQVLVDRVRRALKPFRAFAHLRRNDGDEVARNHRRKRPRPVHVLDERLRFVLDEQIDRVHA